MGVGKVGAYTNYFLEFYAGLIWLAASAWRRPAIGDQAFNTLSTSEPIAGDRVNRSSVYYLQTSLYVTLLLAGALLRYYPTWSENYLKLAGIIEGRNPPRLVIGGYGVWQDLQRERDILSALARINAALVGEVRAAGAPIFTDIPGVAAQAGQVSRLQAFEYRQLLDAGAGRSAWAAARPGQRPRTAGCARLPGQLADARDDGRDYASLRPGRLARHLRSLSAGRPRSGRRH